MGIVDEDIERLRSTVSIVDIDPAVRGAEAGRAELGRAVPVPRGEERVVQRPRGDGPLQVLRLRQGAATCSRSSRRSSTSTSSGAVEHLAAQGRASSSTTRRRASRRNGQRRKQLIEAMEAAVEWYHQRLLDRPRRPSGPRLPAQSRVWRRRRPPVQARLGARRLGRAVARARRCPSGRAAGQSVWRSATGATSMQDSFRARVHVPDLLRVGRGGGVRRADPAGLATIRRSTRTRPRPPIYTQVQGAVRPQLGQGRHRPQPTRWWCARATPT